MERKLYSFDMLGKSTLWMSILDARISTYCMLYIMTMLSFSPMIDFNKVDFATVAVIGTATAVLIIWIVWIALVVVKHLPVKQCSGTWDRFVNYVSGLMLGAWMMGVIFSWTTLNMVVAAIAVVVLSASFLRFVFIDSSSEL